MIYFSELALFVVTSIKLPENYGSKIVIGKLFWLSKLLFIMNIFNCPNNKPLDPPVLGEVMGSILGPNHVTAKDFESCTYACYVRCATLIV